MGYIGFDRETVHFNLGRLKKGHEKYEIDIDPDKAMAYKNGLITDIHEVLKATKIFSDAKKGLEVSPTQLDLVFKTHDPLEVAKIIIAEGEIQLTEDYRKKLREAKMAKILAVIHRNGVDPKTHLPHPMTRLENAFAEAKIRVDEFKSAEDQVQDILSQLRRVLPIKFELKEISVKIPPEYAAKSYPVLKSMGRLLKDDWQSDGSLLAIVEIPGGLETDFYDKLNSFTHGNNEAKVLKTK